MQCGTYFVQIFIADLFLVVDDTDLANYANNNNLYCSNDCVNDVITSLTESAKELLSAIVRQANENKIR